MDASGELRGWEQQHAMGSGGDCLQPHGRPQVGLRLEGDICKLISDVPGHRENFNGWGELRPYTVPLMSQAEDVFMSSCLPRNTSTADPTRRCWLRSRAASEP